MSGKPINFDVTGELVKARGGARSRPMAGWLTTYGQLGPDGKIRETFDRDDQVMEAARKLGAIRWDGYLKKGVWNDTHRPGVIVGLPTSLEFHGGDTPLSKAHRKIGFFTEGHLFDRNDPGSWAGLTDSIGNARTPTDHEFKRADHFWNLANLLKGSPRGIGLSAEGKMALSPCRRRIIQAQIDAAAVCEYPRNPDATLEPLSKGGATGGSKGGATPAFMLGVPDFSACGRCSCPAGSCANLKKAGGEVWIDGLPEPTSREDLILRFAAHHKISQSGAERILHSVENRLTR